MDDACLRSGRSAASPRWGEERVTPLELFFDLVFVFALTQVTGFLVDHLARLGMLQAAALLTVLWTSWASYSWLTNAVPAQEVIPARLVNFATGSDREKHRVSPRALSGPWHSRLATAWLSFAASRASGSMLGTSPSATASW
jgi:hypothetical protein